MLQLYDTARRAKVDFVPSVEGRVSMYVCGPTPYDVPHLGHGRKEVVFDTIRRYLVWRGFGVTYVSNVTDIEDKIIARAHEDGTTEAELVAKYEGAFRSAFDRLNILRPDDEPRATEWIDEMVALIAQLVATGHAYVVEGQGVYFQVDSLPDYGSLSHRTLEELLESAGARVDVDERKRSPVDFALWKTAKPGEPAWESPWGLGRPGWHIECSAMSLKLLGDGFDIHGGGSDLVFPHHENEIAQAVGAGHEFARLLAAQRHAERRRQEDVEVARELHHPRRGVGEVRPARVSPAGAADPLPQADGDRREGVVRRGEGGRSPRRVGPTRTRPARCPSVALGDTTPFRDAMDDDFDTPAALAYIFELVRDANIALDEELVETAAMHFATVQELAGVLGLEVRADPPQADTEIEQLVEAREAARRAKDWAEADRIRGALTERGVVVEDTPRGPEWRRE